MPNFLLFYPLQTDKSPGLFRLMPLVARVC